MNSSWTTVTFGNLASIKHGYAFAGEHFCQTETRDVLLTPGNFALGGGFKLDRPKFYNGPVPAAFVLDPGALVVTMTDLSKTADTLGYGARVPQHDRYRFLHNQRIGLVELKNEAPTTTDFLYWVTRTDEYRHQIVASASGSTVKHTAPSRIETYSFQLPPLPEQHAIARILGALDDKIELNRKTNETLEAMARALFQSWFVDFDPVRAKMEGRQPEGMDAETAKAFPAAFREAELHQVPDGWVLAPLSTSASIVMGASPPGDSYNESGAGTPLINGPVEFGAYHPLRRKWTTQPTRLSADGDLIFCVRGSTTGKMIVADGEYVLGRGVAAIRSEDGCQPYVNWLVKTQLARLLERTSGSVFPNLSGDDLRDFPVLTPGLPIRRLFSRLATPLASASSYLVSEAEGLTALRDALLPKLLSGELRVPEAERAVSKVL